MFNANNYGYNPYGRYIPQQPMYQSNNEPFGGVQSRPGLNGKSVESLEVVKAMDIPLDGSISYFPLTDGNTIVTKQLQKDGTSKTLIYKLLEENQVEDTYIDDIKKLKKDFETLKKQFKELEKKSSDEDE